MTYDRVFTAGGEIGSTDEFDAVINATNFYTVSDKVNTGTYSFYVLAYTSIGTRLPHGIASIPPTRQISGGYFMYGSDSMISNDLTFSVNQGGGTRIASIEMSGNSGSGAWDLLINDVEQDSEDFLTDESWYHIGYDIKIDSSAGWFYVYKDGVEVLSFEGNTGDVDIEQMRIGHIGYDDQGANYYFDDIYVDDSTGESKRTPPVLKFYPNLLDGNGHYSDWVGSDGNSTDNYQLLNELPPSESDYVNTFSGLSYDSYTLTNHVLNEGELIKAVIPMAWVNRENITEKIGIGTRYSSTDVVASGVHVSLSPGYISDRQAVKPGGGDWDQTAISGYELVIVSEGTY